MPRAPALAFALLVVAGCGGAQPDPVPYVPPAGPPATEQGVMIPPEKMDEVNRDLERKRPIMAHCLAIAVDNHELPKASAGKVALAITISPAGHADDVHVIRETSTLDSKQLSDCLIEHVKEIDFPQLPKPYDTSFTYRFEAM